jgi:hypothetical protein
MAQCKMKCQGCSRFPDQPDLAHERLVGLERDLPRLPAQRRRFARGMDVLERLDLPDQFVGIAPHFGHEDLSTDDEIGVNDESPANVHTGLFVVHAIDRADSAAVVGRHWERHAAGIMLYRCTNSKRRWMIRKTNCLAKVPGSACAPLKNRGTRSFGFPDAESLITHS